MAERPFGHEPSAIHVGRVRILLGVLALCVLIAVGVLYLVLRAVMPNHAQVEARRDAIPPAPRLQAHPQVDLAALRAQKRQLLTHYAWTDATHRYARIPIERAMQLYVQQQAKAQPAPRAAAAGGSRP